MTACAPWASIHLAGGFAMGKIADTDKAALMAQLNGNLVSCFLCCRAAVNAMLASGQGGRIVNVAARPALEPRSGAGMTAYTVAKAGVAALTVALAEEVGGRRHPGQRGGALDHGHARQPRRHAEGRFRYLAEGGRSGGDDPVPGLAGQQGHARRGRAGLREGVSALPSPRSAGSGSAITPCSAPTPKARATGAARCWRQPRCALPHRSRGSSRYRRDRRGN